MLGFKEQTISVTRINGHFDETGWISEGTETLTIKGLVQPSPGTVVADTGAGESQEEDWLLFVPSKYAALRVGQDSNDKSGDTVTFSLPDGRQVEAKVVSRYDWRGSMWPLKYAQYGLRELTD